MEKKSVVKTVQANGTFDFNNKTFYVFEIEMENGDIGSYNSLSANQTKFLQGSEVDYLYDTAKPQYPKIKPVYKKFAGAYSGHVKEWNSLPKPEQDQRQLMIVKQSSIKVAVDLCLAEDNTDLKDVFAKAEKIVSWVMAKEEKAEQKQTDSDNLPF